MNRELCDGVLQNVSYQKVICGFLAFMKNVNDDCVMFNVQLEGLCSSCWLNSNIPITIFSLLCDINFGGSFTFPVYQCVT